MDHLGDVVDGVVITTSVGMLTLDVLGAVEGAACHIYKELWSQSQLPWEHDTLVYHWLVTDNGNQPTVGTVQSNCPHYVITSRTKSGDANG